MRQPEVLEVDQKIREYIKARYGENGLNDCSSYELSVTPGSPPVLTLKMYYHPTTSKINVTALGKPPGSEWIDGPLQ